MRHGKKFNHLGRTASHRSAMLSNMASSLILEKRISTTVAKAKELRKFVEPLLTKAKVDSTHSRRTVFSYLQNKDSVKTLFDEVSKKIAERPGGYTRIIRVGNRLGDNAEMCIMELVDYNDLYTQSETQKTKTRRSSRRRGKKSKSGSEETSQAEAKSETTETSKETKAAAPKAEAPKAEAKDQTAKVESPKTENKSSTEKKAEGKGDKKSDKDEEGK